MWVRFSILDGSTDRSNKLFLLGRDVERENGSAVRIVNFAQ